MAEQQSVISDSMPVVETPEELREFLNGNDTSRGAIYELNERLRLANKGEDDKKFSLREDDREFSVNWLHQASKRLLVIQNSLSRLPGIFLNVPVDLHENKVGFGGISASFAPMVENRRLPEPYNEGMGIVGSPQAVVKIMIVAGQELSVAAGIVPVEDI